MGSKAYGAFMKILEKWPVDSSRKGRDLGEKLRQIVSKEFPQGAASKIDETVLQRQINAYEKLIKNASGEKYQLEKISTVTGLSNEHLKAVTSTEFMEAVAETGGPTSLWDRIKNFKIR